MKNKENERKKREKRKMKEKVGGGKIEERK